MYLLMLAWRLALAWLAYQIVIAIRDVYYGPLSNIPGPRLAATSRLLLSRQRLKGTSESWRKQLHEQYGDVVRIAPSEISFASGKAYKDIYGSIPGSKVARFQKDPQFYISGSTDKSRVSLLMAGDADHVRQRKIFSHAFSDKAIKQQEPILMRYIDQLVRNLHTLSDFNVTTDIVSDYNFTVFDIMGDLAWGESLGCLQNSDYIPWVSMIFAAVKFMTYMSEILRLSFAAMLLAAMLPTSLKKKAQSHMQFSVDRVDQRLAKEDARPDIWGIVLAAKEDEQLLLGEMHANAHLFMIAGTETTATFMSGFTYNLLLRPEMMKKLTTEIRNAFKSSNDITINAVSKLSYFEACIKESFRVYPPVPIGLARMVSKGGATICGYTLPVNTSVSVHPLATNSNPNNYHRPDEFLPQRWLEDALTNPASEFHNDDRASLQPFSLGPANCIGINLANLEIRLILASVLYHFDLTLCDESKSWGQQKIFNLWEKGPLMVKVKACQ